jgi:HNH endonuclease
MKLEKENIDFFWTRVPKLAEHKCWKWTGYLNKAGYGEFWISRKTGRKILAHRFSYMLKNNFDPKGFHICHKCDEPSCVNPKHLFIGTAKDNAEDCVRKGRHKNLIKTNCPKGHVLSGENLVPSHLPRRTCRICLQKRQRDSYQKKKLISKHNQSADSRIEM